MPTLIVLVTTMGAITFHPVCHCFRNVKIRACSFQLLTTPDITVKYTLAPVPSRFPETLSWIALTGCIHLHVNLAIFLAMAFLLASDLWPCVADGAWSWPACIWCIRCLAWVGGKLAGKSAHLFSLQSKKAALYIWNKWTLFVNWCWNYVFFSKCWRKIDGPSELLAYICRHKYW